MRTVVQCLLDGWNTQAGEEDDLREATLTVQQDALAVIEYARQAATLKLAELRWGQCSVVGRNAYEQYVAWLSAGRPLDDPRFPAAVRTRRRK